MNGQTNGSYSASHDDPSDATLGGEQYPTSFINGSNGLSVFDCTYTVPNDADYPPSHDFWYHPTNVGNFRSNSLINSPKMKPHFTCHNQHLFNASNQVPPSTSMEGFWKDSSSNSASFRREWPEGVILMGKKVLSFTVKYALSSFCVWAVLYILSDNLALPGGTFFALIILEVAALLLGYISTLLMLPPMTGMLCAGLILRNVPYVNVARDLTLAISSPLRGISVVILLTRGAFSVDFDKIKTLKRVVPFLAVGSCVIEALCASIAAYFIIGLSPAWAALIGCIMSAMSGAGAMPYLLRIDAKIDSVTATPKAKEAVMIAKTACGLDAILAICLAECSFGFIANEELEAGLTKGLAEVGLGAAFAICWGGTAGVLLINDQVSELHILTIFSGGVMSLLGLTKIGYPRGGPLGVFLGSLIAVTIWKWKNINLEKLTQAYDSLWFIFQPLLFGIIGARTNLSTIDWEVIYKGVICLIIGLVGRIIACFLLTWCSGLPLRERIFIVIAWCGKGTVQAALGPVALDTAMDLGVVAYQETAINIMNLAVMTILLASITGYLALNFLGPRILLPK